MASSDLDIVIKIDADFLKMRHDEEDDFDSMWAFKDDHEESWVGELIQISPWHVHLEWYLPDMERLSVIIEQESMLIYERLRRSIEPGRLSLLISMPKM